MASTWLLDAIQVESTTTLVLVALVLALLNAVIKPILVLFTLPFVIFTFGLGIILINAILLFLAGQLVPGFIVPTFGTACLGALIISAVSFAVTMILPPRPKMNIQWSVSSSGKMNRSRKTISKKDVIDV